MPSQSAGNPDNIANHFDALVIGAGFGGIYALHKMRDELGLHSRAFDKAAGIGGTWFWNRYPGAKSDSESFVYRYSFDREMLQNWTWTNRYLEQQETLDYLNAVVDKHNLRKDIQLETGVVSAHFDDASNTWTVLTDTHERFTCTYLITALGVLSTINTPKFPGLENFAGQIVHTGAWPEGLTVGGKRVAVVGTGSTGTQFICTAAETAQHLTVFQRTPQYSVPSGNGPVDAEYLQYCRDNYDQIWNQVKNSIVGCGFEESTIAATSVTAEERQRVFEDSWQRGNAFHYMFGTFSDIIFDPVANEYAASFIRSKIRNLVRDPETARKLTPTGYYATRPIANKGYYETYNRENVDLVSIRETPIAEVTAQGIRTSDGVEHQFDLLVFATGFDAVDGGYKRLDLRGKSGTTIRDHWKNGPTSYLGVATPDFPNMFMIYGPNSVFTNLPPGIETQVEWISELIKSAEKRQINRIEATTFAQAEWVKLCDQIANASLFPKANSWIFGANIPKKEKRTMFYFAGLGNYRKALAAEATTNYPGFELTRHEKTDNGTSEPAAATKWAAL